MTEWDQKLAKIVEETERHLASVKSQLRSSATNGAPSSLSFKNSYTPVQSYRRNSQTPPPSILRTIESGRGSSLLSSGLVSPPKRNVSFESTSSFSNHPSALTILSEKIREQQRDVNNLRESVRSLHGSLRQQQEQLKSLREELQLSRLQLEEDSSGMKVDRKIQKLKEELVREVEQLKRKVQVCSPGNVRGSHTSSRVLTSLTNDFCEFKLQTDQRLSDLQQEFSATRADLARYESRVSRVSSGLKELEKEHEKSTRVISEVKGRQLGEDVTGSRTNHCLADLSSEVRKLKQLVVGLELRLSDLEEAGITSKLKPNKPELFRTQHARTSRSSEDSDGSTSLSLGIKEHSSKSSACSRGRGNPLHSLVGKPPFSAGRAAVMGGVGVGLPQRYLERSSDDVDSLTSLNDDESTLAGGGLDVGAEEDLSLSTMDLSDLEDSTFNDVDDFILDSDGTLSPGSSL